ncbi:MAG: hypothetical protein ACYDD1_18095 [Caulobacteraceae bacterium]
MSDELWRRAQAAFQENAKLKAQQDILSEQVSRQLDALRHSIDMMRHYVKLGSGNGTARLPSVEAAACIYTENPQAKKVEEDTVFKKH